MIKYLGSKRLLLPRIVAIARSLGVRTAIDPFSGTARVGHALKREGVHVTAGDHNQYAAVLARCYVQADARVLGGEGEREVGRVIGELQREKEKKGWFTQTFAVESRYFHPDNAARIEAIRERIASLSLSPNLESIALVSLMEAADRVDSTVGVQMAYLKTYAPRAHNALTLRIPDVLPGPGRALCADALELVRGDADLLYLDPPYNQHSYRGNYHVWETLVRWDRPETYGIARKRIDVRTTKSDFNSKAKIRPALAALLDAARARFVLLSFNDEGYLGIADLRALLATHGRVLEASVDFPRYVGAKIGIHNPRGEKVGKVGRLRNREHLFLVDRHGALPQQFSLDASLGAGAHLRA